MGLEDSLPNKSEKTDLDKNEGVHLTSDNYLDDMSHPFYDYLMGGIVLAGTAFGTYIGYKTNNPIYGAFIGAGISSFVVGAAMEDRDEREYRQKRNKE